MTFYVCPRCGNLGHLRDDCRCGTSARWLYSFGDLDEAIELRDSIRSVRSKLNLDRDDADTLGEVCAAYNRLDERVAKLEAALAPILARGLHSVKA